jgi:hypothetical protein
VRLKSFQRLALWTTATTYPLILVGGLVRASGAGLGCPDWPGCFGSWIRPHPARSSSPFDPSQFNPALMWTETREPSARCPGELPILPPRSRRGGIIGISRGSSDAIAAPAGWLRGLAYGHVVAHGCHA